MNAAIIDIGSNSIRLLLNGKKQVTTTRLAKGIAATGALCEESMAHTTAVIKGYKEEAARAGAPVFAYATSAVRDAANREEFTRRVLSECGVEVDVLSGEREALYAFCAVDADGLIDIGGGSSQLVTEDYSNSFPMGCVKARELAVAAGDTPEAQRAALYERFGSIYRFPRFRVDDWVGVGGTFTTLGAIKLGQTVYDGAAVSRTTLSYPELITLTDRLWHMDRAAHPLLTQRHDVIIYGALIARYIMEGMNIPALRLSDADGMEGYLMMLNAC